MSLDGPKYLVCPECARSYDTNRWPMCPVCPAEVPYNQKYYIQDARQYVGNCMLWWRKGGSGYTTHIDEAGIFDADYVKDMRPTDVPWPIHLINNAASLQVDMQRVEGDEARAIKDAAWKRQQEANKPAPKTVTNCSKCGRVFYDPDPHINTCLRCAT